MAGCGSGSSTRQLSLTSGISHTSTLSISHSWRLIPAWSRKWTYFRSRFCAHAFPSRRFGNHRVFMHGFQSVQQMMFLYITRHRNAPPPPDTVWVASLFLTQSFHDADGYALYESFLGRISECWTGPALRNWAQTIQEAIQAHDAELAKHLAKCHDLCKSRRRLAERSVLTFLQRLHLDSEMESDNVRRSNAFANMPPRHGPCHYPGHTSHPQAGVCRHSPLHQTAFSHHQPSGYSILPAAANTRMAFTRECHQKHGQDRTPEEGLWSAEVGISENVREQSWRSQSTCNRTITISSQSRHEYTAYQFPGSRPFRSGCVFLNGRSSDEVQRICHGSLGVFVQSLILLSDKQPAMLLDDTAQLGLCRLTRAPVGHTRNEPREHGEAKDMLDGRGGYVATAACFKPGLDSDPRNTLP